MRGLSQSLGLPFYPGQGPFTREQGAVIGARDGFLVAAGPVPRGGSGILIRFSSCADPKKIEAALNDNKKMPSQMDIEAGSRFVDVRWAHSFGAKPGPEEVASVLGAALETVRTLATPLDGRCEKCQGPTKAEIVLQDGAPSYYCQECQQRLPEELDRARREYEEQPTHLLKGVLYGLAAALAVSLALGGAEFATEEILKKNYLIVLVVGMILVGKVVGAAVVTGGGKITPSLQFVAAALTILSLLLGDAFFIGLVLSTKVHVVWGEKLLREVFADLWDLERIPSLLISVVAGFFAFVFLSGREPEFEVKFERLGSPDSGA